MKVRNHPQDELLCISQIVEHRKISQELKHVAA